MRNLTLVVRPSHSFKVETRPAVSGFALSHRAVRVTGGYGRI
jgi:hypothetical protein